MPNDRACVPPAPGETVDRTLPAGDDRDRPLCVRLIELDAPEGLDLNEVAEASGAFPQIRWTDSATGERWLGLGAADDLTADSETEAWELPNRCRARLARIRSTGPARPFLRYFGGIAFDPGDLPHFEWRSGGRGRFVLPRVLLRQDRQGRTGAAVIAPADPGRSAAEGQDRRASETVTLARAAISSPRVLDLPALGRIEIDGARERWIQAVGRAIGAIDRGAIRKIVLSRDFLLTSKAAIPPLAIVKGIEPRSAHGQVFCFRFEPETAFLGATPERLVSLDGPTVSCDCLAGTGPRAVDPGADAACAARLLGSEKDAREHRFVRDGIVSTLEPLARWIEVESRPSILRLTGLHHLSTSIRGCLKEGVGLAEILRRLHPTPAVGGSPRVEALAMIRELEGRPRGWYAGPVGWIGLDRADLAVGIRSALVQGERLRAFAGAGIVRGSDPCAEWEETARKADSFLALFTEAPS